MSFVKVAPNSFIHATKLRKFRQAFPNWYSFATSTFFDLRLFTLFTRWLSRNGGTGAKLQHSLLSNRSYFTQFCNPKVTYYLFYISKNNIYHLKLLIKITGARYTCPPPGGNEWQNSISIKQSLISSLHSDLSEEDK